VNLLGLLLSLGLVVLAVRLRVNLAHGLLAGGLVLTLTGRLGLAELGQSLAASLLEPKGYGLVLTVGLLTVLVRHQELTGQWEAALTRVRRYITSPRVSLALFPALIGLLPMPGGSIFSAPLVDKLSLGLDLESQEKSLLNYWFRHVWEYAWPLYPPVITAAALGRVSIASLSLTAAPVCLAAIGLGVLGLLRRLPAQTPVSVSRAESTGSPWAGLVPTLVVLAGSFIGPDLIRRMVGWLPLAAQAPEMAAMVLALAVAVGLATAWDGRTRLLTQAAFSAHTWSMVYLTSAILAFKGLAESSGALAELSRTITQLHLPVWLVVLILPFLIGLITGYALAHVAAGFPVFLGLLQPDQVLVYLMLGHVAGFAGVLLSPAHACMVLSNQYFGCPTGPFYRRLAPLVAGIVIFALALGGLRLSWLV
jgi:integral membrane protein (TIGR00529 family)